MCVIQYYLRDANPMPMRPKAAASGSEGNILGTQYSMGGCTDPELSNLTEV